MKLNYEKIFFVVSFYLFLYLFVYLFKFNLKKNFGEFCETYNNNRNNNKQQEIKNRERNEKMRFSCLFQHISPFKYERIDKILTERGIKSRNEATKLLQSGKVKVNGIIIRGRGERFPSNIEINIENKLLPCIPLLVLYHKPINVLSSMGDPWGRQNLSELSKKYSYLNDMHPVVRYFYYYYYHNLYC